MMKRASFLIAIGFAAGLSCSEDPMVTRQPEVFRGLMVMTPELVSDPMQIYPDSVVVTLTVDGILYDLVQEGTSRFNLCDSYGEVGGFGTNRATLTPTGVHFAGNCDSVHVPHGEFASIFRADSLYLGPKRVGFTRLPGDTITFHFKLRQVQ